MIRTIAVCLFVPLLSILIQGAGTAHAAHDTDLTADVLELIRCDASLIADNGAAGIACCYGLLRPCEYQVSWTHDIPDQVRAVYWNACQTVQYKQQGSDPNWWLTTADNLRPCIFVCTVDWYAEQNGFDPATFRSGLAKLISEADDLVFDTSGLDGMTGQAFWKTASWNEGEVWVTVRSKDEVKQGSFSPDSQLIFHLDNSSYAQAERNARRSAAGAK